MLNCLVAFLFLALSLDFVLFVFAISRKDRSRSVYFALLTFALLFYSLGYLLEVMSETPRELMMALRVENAGIPFIAPFFALTGISLFDKTLLRKWMLPVSAIFGATFFTIVFFNNSHRLYYTSVELAYNGVRYYAQLKRGPLYIVMQLASSAIMVVAFIKLFKVMMQGRNFIKTMKFMMTGAVLVFLANVLNFTAIFPQIDCTPLMLTAALGFFSYDILRHNLLDVVTIAQDSAVQTMDDAMIIVDDEWHYLFSNDSAKALFPGLSGDMEMKPVTSVPNWPEELGAKREACYVNFVLNEADSEKRRRYRANISKVIVGSDKVVGWSIVIRDMTEILELMKRYEDLANIDSLTGVLNRRYFLERVQEEKDLAMRHNLWQSIIMFDIDYFKRINDRYGHAAGDYVLRGIAEVVKNNLRPYDLVGRFGGEEFVIYLISNQNDSLQNISNRLCRAVEETDFVFNGAHIHVTISVGALLISPSISFETALQIADESMYKAKAAGRNCAVVGQIQMDEYGNPVERGVKLHVQEHVAVK